MVKRGGCEGIVGIEEVGVLGLAEMFLKKEYEVNVTGRNRDGGKRASGGVAVVVHKSLELRVWKSREGLVCVEWSRVGRKMMIGVVYVSPEGVREMERLFEVLRRYGEV